MRLHITYSSPELLQKYPHFVQGSHNQTAENQGPLPNEQLTGMTRSAVCDAKGEYSKAFQSGCE